MTVEELFAPYSPRIRAIAERARTLVLDVFPGAIEHVDAANKMIHYGFGTKMGQRVFYVAGFTSHVDIGLWHGNNTSDPCALLEGTGKKLRHVKLRTKEDVDRPALRELLAASLAAAGTSS